MPTTIQHDSDNVFCVRASGILTKAEMDQMQAVAAKEIARIGRLKILFILDQFQGWQRGEDWGDVSFFFEHGGDIERIAIVGDEKWRDEALMFAGAGMRTAEVKFFPPAENAQARAWLAQ